MHGASNLQTMFRSDVYELLRTGKAMKHNTSTTWQLVMLNGVFDIVTLVNCNLVLQLTEIIKLRKHRN